MRIPGNSDHHVSGCSSSDVSRVCSAMDRERLRIVGQCRVVKTAGQSHSQPNSPDRRAGPDQTHNPSVGGSSPPAPRGKAQVSGLFEGSGFRWRAVSVPVGLGRCRVVFDVMRALCGSWGERVRCPSRSVQGDRKASIPSLGWIRHAVDREGPYAHPRRKGVSMRDTPTR